MVPNSETSKFYKLSLDRKRQVLKDRAGLTDEDIRILSTGLELAAAERMIENVVGIIQVPIGIATNFRINGRDYLVPMAIEEASVVAAASHAAKLALPTGGFKAIGSRPVMRGQIQVVDVKDLEEGRRRILDVKKGLIERANRFADLLPSLGGGVLDISAKIVGPPEDGMLIVEFFVDCKDAMGANTVITIAEGISPEIEGITGGRSLLKIISNLATERMAKAMVTYKKDVIGGERVVDGIVKAYKFACYDPYRAATHNKGIMNGITAITLATANDTRAIEAGAHAYASISGKYLPLSKWSKDKNGDLVGELELPLALGTFGGATRTHPVAQLCLKILGVKTATELAEVACAVGLAQNFAALRAMVTEGIKRGHMELHARNIAIMAGAKGDLVDKLAELLVKEGNVGVSRAKEILQSLK
ncbi:MAG: hydroxymethylglutaryl-CoA reductase, degradative [Candidatus Methanomethyliaceae archaeon]|nr:hydroxymethylglutaryl-CoA reductase, degradative [Candidatus Methanomethyliaceae archaeon]MDD1766517.1 hydroxymethylglutaryl-CoA reductase, degradative [Candidatus Methanomethyliaceae archaeon]